MSVKAFFIECSLDFWPLVAQRLARHHGWSVAYWTGTGAVRSEVRKLFPEAIFHLNTEAVLGRRPPELAGLAPRPMDLSDWESMSTVESLTLKMMDRLDPEGSFNYFERINHFHHLTAYWSAVVEKLRPDVIVHSNLPHVVYDYVLYELAKKVGIPNVMLDVPSLPGRVHTVREIEKGPVFLESAYERLKAEGEEPEPSPEARQYLRGIRGEYSQGKPYYLRQHQRRDDQSRASLGWKSIVDHALSFWRWPQAVARTSGRLARPAPPNYLVQPGKPPYLSAWSPTRWQFYLWKRRLHVARLERSYARLSQTPPRDEPYIFVPLHYQPEKTTSPQGGLFVHQHLMVERLSACLPAQWRIYVKEAAPQFMPAFRGGPASRPDDYYARLAAIPGVRLMPAGLDSFGLIDGAKATATVTGTAGWESLVRGKPVLLFGYGWYQSAEGVFATLSRRDLGLAMQKIAEGVRIDPRKTDLFVQALEASSVRGYILARDQPVANLTAEENARQIAGEIVRTVKPVFA
jgi:hypothetical protein